MTGVKKSVEAARKSSRKPKTVSQVSAVDTIIESRNVKQYFDALPPVEDYHFVAIGVSSFFDKNTHAMKLYLGQNATCRTWAFLKHWPMSTTKGSEVLFVNEYPHGDSQTLKEISRMGLMYPFKAFKDKNLGQSIRHLSHFVQYVFLYTGKVDKVFPQSLITAEELLIAAVGTINSIYKSKGGVEAIPDCHPPGPFNDAAFDDDRIPLLPHTNARATRAHPASLIAKLSVAPDTLASIFAAPANSKGKAKAAAASNPLGPAEEDDAQTVISEGMRNMGLKPLDLVTDIISKSKRKADADEKPFEHWKKLKIEKQKEARREKEIMRQLKEVQARQARYDSEMEIVARQQPVDIIIRWAAADVEDSDEDGVVNPVLDEH